MYGNKDATDQDIKEALEKANAISFVNQMENKIDTYIGSSAV